MPPALRSSFFHDYVVIFLFSFIFDIIYRYFLTGFSAISRSIISDRTCLIVRLWPAARRRRYLLCESERKTEYFSGFVWDEISSDVSLSLGWSAEPVLVMAAFDGATGVQSTQ